MAAEPEPRASLRGRLLGFSALRIPRRRTVRGVLDGLARKDQERTSADIEACREFILQAIAGIEADRHRARLDGHSPPLDAHSLDY